MIRHNFTSHGMVAIEQGTWVRAEDAQEMQADAARYAAVRTLICTPSAQMDRVKTIVDEAMDAMTEADEPPEVITPEYVDATFDKLLAAIHARLSTTA